MSEKVDKFIKSHKEYFKRNAIVIENNLWDKEEDLSKKAKLFKQENELTTSILGRLSAFIKGAEADRKLPKTQKFIDDTLSIINTHINKCDKYLDYKMDEYTDSSDDTEEEIDLKNQEISFQDEVFTKKIAIQEKIDSLNIKFSAEDLSFRFYNDQIASLPMASVLTVVNNDIKEATEALNLPTEITDNTFYIDLLKQGKVLQWNEKKHFWEQDKKTLYFWQNQWLLMTKGVEVDGYFIHPWLYWHINFFKTPIPQDDGSEPIVSPDFRDNEWLFVEDIKRAEKLGNQGVMLYGSRRLGKALRNDQKLYYTDGSERPIGDAKEGDFIFGADGKPTKILGVYPQGKVDLYKVKLQDGRESICCDEHLWTVYDYQAKCYKTLPLKELMRDGYSYQRQREWNGNTKTSNVYKYYLPINDAVEYSKTELPIEPYYLGMWLGDGTSANTSITTIDEESKIYLKSFADRNELIYTETSKIGTDAIRVNLSKRIGYGKNNKLRDSLRKLNVFSNKHIPTSYLKSSVEDRMELLRGLMDTDGTIAKDGGGIQIALASEVLAKNVLELCRSLGIACHLKHKKGKYIKKSGDFNDVYKVTLFTNKPIFKLQRKLDRIDKNPIPARVSKMDRVAIISIEKVESAEATCIRVDNDSKLFLTNDYIVTHNSTLMSSYSLWKALTKPNSSATVTSGSEGDLIDLTHKIKTAMKYVPKAFYLYVQSQEWLGGSVELGLKTSPSNLVEYSRFIIKNLAGGTTKSTQKTAGGAPSVFLIEEIGKFDWKKSYLAAKPSFETKTRWKCVPIAVGTGGEASLSGDAMNALSNPSALNFLEMDWDTFESKIPKEAISWKRRVFATFVPAQMSYKTGLKSIKRPFGEFLGLKSEFLDRITIHQADWEHNLKVLLEDRKKAESDNILLQQETVQYPIDPEEVFLSADISPFSNVIEEARKHREYLVQTGKWDRRRTLTKDNQGKIHSDISTKELVDFPFNGDNQDAPYLIIEDIPDFKPPKYMYVASADFYKQEKTTTTNSVCTVGIYKFPLFGDENGKKLVASYAGRPKTYKELNEKVLILLEAYNAVMLPENEDLGVFQTYLETLRLEEQYLEKHIDFNTALKYSDNDARKWGYTPKQSKRKLISMYANYLSENVVVKNDEGQDVTVKRVQTIDDIWLLSEIINYSETGNFDRVSGHIGAIGLIHVLEKNYIYPKGMLRKKDTEETKEVKKPRSKSFYNTTVRSKSFYGRR